MANSSEENLIRQSGASSGLSGFSVADGGYDLSGRVAYDGGPEGMDGRLLLPRRHAVTKGNPKVRKLKGHVIQLFELVGSGMDRCAAMSGICEWGTVWSVLSYIS